MTVYLVVLLSVLNSIGQRGSKVAVSLYALELGSGSFTVGLLAAMFAAFPLLLAVHAGRISATFALGGSIAAFVGPSLAGFGIEIAGYRATFATLAVIAVMPALIVLLHKALIPAHARHGEETANSALDLLANAALRRTLIM